MVIDAWRRQILEDCPGLVLISGRTLLVGVGCLEFAITQAEANSLVVIGMEGFRTDGVALTPLIEFVADLDEVDGVWAERVRSSSEAARSIAAAWSRGPEFIELVLAAQDE